MIPVHILYHPGESEVYLYEINHQVYAYVGFVIEPVEYQPEGFQRIFTYPAGRDWLSKPLLIITENGWVVYTSQEDNLNLEYSSSPDLTTLGKVEDIIQIEIPDLTRENEDRGYVVKGLPKFNTVLRERFDLLLTNRLSLFEIYSWLESFQRKKIFPLAYEAILNKWYFHRSSNFPLELILVNRVAELINKNKVQEMKADPLLQIWAPPGNMILTLITKEGDIYRAEVKMEGTRIFPLSER